MTSTSSTPVHAETATVERRRRAASETKAAYKTTEFIVYVAAVVGVLIASNVVGLDENQRDYFPADRAWLYVTLLTIGYMISRGLAKAGNRSVDDA
ncbi:MAG: hypothetical protein ACXVRP_11470 [Solirubrobacteraceae bacterium]